MLHDQHAVETVPVFLCRGNRTCGVFLLFGVDRSVHEDIEFAIGKISERRIAAQLFVNRNANSAETATLGQVVGSLAPLSSKGRARDGDEDCQGGVLLGWVGKVEACTAP